MKKYLLLLLICTKCSVALTQGFYNHIWLTGNNPFINFPNGRIEFDSTSYVHTPEFRKMSFKGTQATICDAQGNFLMSSNGIWIANANNDTMLNGGGLNPNGITPNWPYGLIIPYANIFLPFPGDSNKYLLFHHTGTDDGTGLPATELYFSTIEHSNAIDSVISKNQIVFSDTLNWGIGACKHANGRDWWIVMIRHNTSTIYKVLITPQGIYSVTQQNLVAPIANYNVTQLVFSSDGNKFAYSTYQLGTKNSSLLLFDFDRCNGNFSLIDTFGLTTNQYIFGNSFSHSGKFVYACSSTHIFQISVDSFTVDTVASYDGYISPPGQTCCGTTFWNMYLAANGKIYITSGSSVQHLHEMNFPDSAGLACDVQQHAVDLGTYLHLRAVPNHPNYNLGPVLGSVCDTLSVGIPEQEHDFRFGISPNPSADGYINIIYLLPQNKAGVFEVYDMTGQLVYKMNLPPWSTLQQIKLPELSSGVYTCVVRSGYERVGRKLVVMK